MSRPGLLVLVTLAPLLAGCATSGTSGPETGEVNAFDRYHIPPEAVDEFRTESHGTAWELVEQARPRWLRPQQVGGFGSRAETPAVFVDDIRRGGIGALTQIAIDRVEEVRYYPGREATMRFGTGYRAGAIMVYLRRR